MKRARPVIYVPATGRYERPDASPALFGEYTLATSQGDLTCRPVFQLVSDLCRSYSPERVASICWLNPDEVEQAARLLWEARPVAYYSWSGVEQHTNATQFHRALALLYSLTGSFDAPGGNVLFAPIPSVDVSGRELMSSQFAPALGRRERPLGPARMNFATTSDLYRAIEAGIPYPIHGLLGFGANLLIAHAESARGRAALAKLDFYAHADLFMTPTAEMADIVLPVATPFEREALKIGFDVSADAQGFVQLRQRV